jgi:hypothetical protein
MLNYFLRTKHVLTMKEDEMIWICYEIWNRLQLPSKGISMRYKLLGNGFRSKYDFFVMGCRYVLQLLDDRCNDH